VGKKGEDEEVKRWRWNYGRRLEDHLNKEMAERLHVDAANLSAYAKGSKIPGKDYIKHFYMVYPELTEPPDDHRAGSNANKGQQGSQHEEQTSHRTEGPPPGNQPNWDDSDRLRNELFSLYKNNDAFFKTEYNTMNKTILILTQEVAFYRKQTNPGPDSPQ
jgi:hypothetical protein